MSPRMIWNLGYSVLSLLSARSTAISTHFPTPHPEVLFSRRGGAKTQGFVCVRKALVHQATSSAFPVPL